MRKIPKYIFATLLGLIGLFLVSLYFPVGDNLWSIVTGRGYEIPEGSSVFTFRPLLMNTGSGEWWIYGMDGEFYYYQDGTRFRRVRVEDCIDFNPTMVETWCK